MTDHRQLFRRYSIVLGGLSLLATLGFAAIEWRLAEKVGTEGALREAVASTQHMAIVVVVGLVAAIGALAWLVLRPTARQLDRVIEELSDQSGLQRSINEVLDEGVAMLDAEGIIRYCNSAVCRILDIRSPDLVLGKALLSLPWETVREDGTELPREEHPALVSLRTGLASTGAVVGVKWDGIPIQWLAVNTHLLVDARGVPRGVVGSFRDVTVERNADAARLRHAAELQEQAAILEAQNTQLATQGAQLVAQTRELGAQTAELLRTKDFLQGVIANSIDGILTYDRELRHTVWNPAMERITGRRAFAVLGRRVDEALPFVGDTGLDFAYESALAGETAIRTAIAIPHASGATVYVDATFSPLRNEEDEIVGGIAIVRDVTEQRATDTALRERDALTRTFFQHTPVAIAMLDLEMRYVAASDRWRADYAGGRDVIGLSSDDVAARLGPSWHKASLRALDGVSARCEAERVENERGEESWVRWEVNPWYNADRRAGGVIAMIEDITPRMRAEMRLRQSEQRFSVLAHQAPVGIFQTDADGRCTYVNGRYTELTGLTGVQAQGDGWLSGIHPDDRERILRGWNEATEIGAPSRAEFRVVSSQIGVRWVLGTAEALRSESGALAGYIGSIVDITERKQAEEGLRALSTVDDLTGLFNRRGFFTLAEQQIKSATRTRTPLMLFYLDMNDFKQINDRFGHAAGDMALSEMGDLLRTSMRGADIVARMGGDEFVVLAVGVAPDQERVVRERLHAVLEERNATSALPYRLSVSIGAAAFDFADPCALDGLLAIADSRLYEEKRRTKGATTAAA